MSPDTRAASLADVCDSKGASNFVYIFSVRLCLQPPALQGPSLEGGEVGGKFRSLGGLGSGVGEAVGVLLTGRSGQQLKRSLKHD